MYLQELAYFPASSLTKDRRGFAQEALVPFLVQYDDEASASRWMTLISSSRDAQGRSHIFANAIWYSRNRIWGLGRSVKFLDPESFAEDAEGVLATDAHVRGEICSLYYAGFSGKDNPGGFTLTSREADVEMRSLKAVARRNLGWARSTGATFLGGGRLDVANSEHCRSVAQGVDWTRLRDESWHPETKILLSRGADSVLRDVGPARTQNEYGHTRPAYHAEGHEEMLLFNSKSSHWGLRQEWAKRHANGTWQRQDPEAIMLIRESGEKTVDRFSNLSVTITPIGPLAVGSADLDPKMEDETSTPGVLISRLVTY